MLRSLFFVVFLFSVGVSAKLKKDDHSGFSRCSTADMDPLDQIIVENQLNYLRSQRQFKKMNVRALPSLVIPVHIHVISKDKTEKGGDVAEAALVEQIDVLNKAYATMNISFQIIDIDRTQNKKWYDFSYEEVIKKSLHKGDALTLNLYTANPSGGILGWATFPWDFAQNSEMDGVVIHHDTLPGGALKAYNLGGTAIHEVGHWLGLYHTFQGGCQDGDFVADTPAQNVNYGCPQVAPDSCPSSDGVDSIHNYMDYTDDICLTDFSSGQMERIHDSVTSYRN